MFCSKLSFCFLLFFYFHLKKSKFYFKINALSLSDFTNYSWESQKRAHTRTVFFPYEFINFVLPFSLLHCQKISFILSLKFCVLFTATGETSNRLFCLSITDARQCHFLYNWSITMAPHLVDDDDAHKVAAQRDPRTCPPSFWDPLKVDFSSQGITSIKCV